VIGNTIELFARHSRNKLGRLRVFVRRCSRWPSCSERAPLGAEQGERSTFNLVSLVGGAREDGGEGEGEGEAMGLLF